MTLEDLLARLKQSEDPFVERKTTPHVSDVVAALVAFANSVPPGREAVLFLGAKPDGTPVGIDNADKLQQSVGEWARDQCYPPVRVTYEVLTGLAERAVLAVIVQASDERPHFAGPAYVRDGSRTVKASSQVYADLIASRNDKAAVILRHKGATVTVVAQHHLLGEPNRIDRLIAPRYECRIIGASAFSVEFYEVASQQTFSIPLDRVGLSQDVKGHRPLMLTVTAP